MAYFMIGNDPPLFLAQDPVFLLFAHKHQLNRLKQILLGHGVSPVLDGIDGRLIHHVGKVSADGAGGCQRNLLEIHGLIQMDILGMYLQNIDPAL